MSPNDAAFIEVNVEGLADAFGVIFREHIVPDNDRFRFWLENLDKIERTIYVRTIVSVLEECVKAGDLSRVDDSFAICEFVLSHPDDDPTEGFRGKDRSRGGSHWHSARRAVGDYVGTCVRVENALPLAVGERLARLLEMLCLQSDWRLDNNEPVILNREEPHTEAINNTRSVALGSLIQYGLWLRNHYPEADVSFVTSTLEKRFAADAEFPLTVPEYSILGKNYGNMLHLDSEWTKQHQNDIFPQTNPAGWVVSFGALLLFTRCHSRVLETLGSQFRFAIENLSLLEEGTVIGHPPAGRLAQDVFVYYLWGLYPLKGDGSLLEYFYEQTVGRPDRHKGLFSDVGRMLLQSDSLDQDLKEKFTAFFEFRLEEGRPQEFDGFWFWLEAECLDPDWRLDAFLKVLDIGQPSGIELYSSVKTLHQLLPEYPGKVVACFAKIVDGVGENVHEIQTEPAKEILQAGLESGDPETVRMAKRSEEHLLRHGLSGVRTTGSRGDYPAR